jgi:hypothetical protein
MVSEHGACGVGHKSKEKTTADIVKKMMKAGKVKKKCCRSKSRCKKCPVMAMRNIEARKKKAA